MTGRLTVVGSANMDLIIRAPHIPQPGETILGCDFATVPGGKGANQAVAASRLGASVRMVGRVGRDSFGGALLERLAADGVDHAFVLQDDVAATGVALIVVDDAGRNSIVVASGANMRLSAADVDAADAAIADADALLLQLESPLEAVMRAAQVAQSHGVTVLLNPAPARQLPAELLALVNVLIPNEIETALLVQAPVDDAAGVEMAARHLLKMGPGAVILTLGERGALLARGSEMEHYPAFRVTPVDTTAAGDAFVAAFATAYAEGKPLSEAVRWGNAAGALATTVLGAQPSLPNRARLEALLSTGIVEEQGLPADKSDE